MRRFLLLVIAVLLPLRLLAADVMVVQMGLQAVSTAAAHAAMHGGDQRAGLGLHGLASQGHGAHGHEQGTPQAHAHHTGVPSADTAPPMPADCPMAGGDDGQAPASCQECLFCLSWVVPPSLVVAPALAPPVTRAAPPAAAFHSAEPRADLRPPIA